MEINVSRESTEAVIEAGDQDFEAKVIERSLQVPVVVDFWAPWCGPCKVIGPVLEKLAQQWAGRFELVKVNMDESPMLAQALRIQSIPAVKLFINGHIQDEFVGAYPEPEVVRFLEHNLPSEKAEDALQGLNLWQMGDHAGALRIFKQVLANEPKNSAALIGLGHCQLDEGDLDGARETAGKINAAELEKLTERAQLEKLLSILHGRIFLTEAAEPDNAQPAALAAKLAGAAQAALTGQFERALPDLLEIVRTDRKFKDDAGRKAMLAVFDLLPAGDPLLVSYRQKLSNLLFS
jgi:putative thioredoxin